jgi:tetratricopeptide (TPR) repeat protein
MTLRAIQANPYIAGRALRQQRGFVGRADVLGKVATMLGSPHQNALVLYGQRRIGKTSILLQLQRRLSTPLFLPVYFDLMDRARRPLGQVLFELAAQVAAEAGMALPAAPSFDDQGVFFRRAFLPQLYAALGQGRSPVLLLDEFDVLDVAAEERLPESAAAQAFFPYLRELLQEEPRLRFIFAVGRRAEDLSINVKATFKSALYQRVSMLDEESARRLVGAAVREGTLAFGPGAVDRILALTACHPYFVQLMCQIVWDDAHAAQPDVAAPVVDVPRVERAAEKVLEAGQNVFEWIWDGLPPAERVIFAAIAGAADEHTVVGEELLTRLLQSHGVRILTRELELAPETLVQWEMLRRVDGGYRFFAELMRRWVARRKPLPRVKDELDRIVPLADALYRSADAFYRQRDLKDAEAQLRQALRVNPNHLKARLLAAQVLVEQGRLDEAITDLEEAHRSDTDAGRYPLLRALLLRGQAQEQAGDQQGALKSYDYALRLSPREAVASERRIAIWRQIGETALAERAFSAAAYAFAQAGDSERSADASAQASRQARQDEITTLTEEARDREQQEDWAGALATYRQAAAKAPEDQRWQREVQRAAAEHELSERYGAGLLALQRREWESAAADLAAVVQARPGYKDAAKLLEQAERGRRGRRGFTVPRWAIAVVVTLVLAGGGVTAYYFPNWFPSTAEQYYNRAGARSSAGQYDLAIADYTQVIALDPQNADAYADRGRAFYAQGQYDSAVQDLSKAIELNPAPAEYYDTRGDAYRALDQLSQAIADYTAAIEREEQASFYSSRAEAHFANGEFAATVADYTRAIELGGESSHLYVYRAEAHVANGDFPAAVADYTRAIELGDDSASNYLGRGRAYVQKGLTEEAAADFRTALESGSSAEQDEARAELEALGVAP